MGVITAVLPFHTQVWEYPPRDLATCCIINMSSQIVKMLRQLVFRILMNFSHTRLTQYKHPNIVYHTNFYRLLLSYNQFHNFCFGLDICRYDLFQDVLKSILNNIHNICLPSFVLTIKMSSLSLCQIHFERLAQIDNFYDLG